MHDRKILRELAKKYTELAHLPIQKEKRALWQSLNTLSPVRPMVSIDQVCFSEMNFDGSLTLLCKDPFARQIEDYFRKKIFAYTHFPVDMVLENELPIYVSVSGLGLGVDTEEQILRTSEQSEVVSHHFENQFENDADIEKIKMPQVIFHKEKTEEHLSFAHDMVGDILPVKRNGVDPYVSVWDPISMWMGMQELLFALIDRPEFMLQLANKVVQGYMTQLDQLEALGILAKPQHLIHCTGAYTDELPTKEYNENAPKTQDIWMFGLAQPFASVSKEMFDTFEIEPCMPLFERFGLVYYGCCDPLDGKMDEVFKIPHLRKISVSPWANEQKCAERIQNNYVFSRKPNPALLASSTFDEDLIRTHIRQTCDIAKHHNCPVEFILKDISTVKNDPKRLFRYADIMMEEAQR